MQRGGAFSRVKLRKALRKRLLFEFSVGGPELFQMMVGEASHHKRAM